MDAEHTVPLTTGSTTARHYAAAIPSGTLLALAHGAGAGFHHPFMTAFARGLSERGVDVVTFNFPYMEQKRRLPDRAPVLESCVRSIVAWARTDLGLGERATFIGGKSMGGRMATHVASQGLERLDGVVVLGYPLHPPGKPDRARVAHLPAIGVPLLFVQGERDAFGTPAEFAPVMETMRAPVTLHVVAAGDHSFAVRGQPATQVYEPLFQSIAEWILSGSRADRRGPNPAG